MTLSIGPKDKTRVLSKTELVVLRGVVNDFCPTRLPDGMSTGTSIKSTAYRRKMRPHRRWHDNDDMMDERECSKANESSPLKMKRLS